MADTVDARGLSCPQPVLMTLDAIKAAQSDEILVIVDNEASKENVCRAATNKGWTVADTNEEAGECKITIKKG
ncbi:MAG: sulfurtransferase TusA family protein [Deltaproteobacteria bacterium]|nr:sulfurtransferase TusA family protein [Deltaproteobacteria bacterium]